MNSEQKLREALHKAAETISIMQMTHNTGVGDLTLDAIQQALAESVQDPVAWVWNPIKEAWEKVHVFGHWQQGAVYAFGSAPPQPQPVEPLFWYRPRSDGGYDGPLHNDQIEEVRKKSGAWVPLHAGSKPEPVQYAKDSVHFTNNDVKELAAELAEILPKYFYPVQWGNSIMEKAKEFASAWSLVGGRFDDGTALAHAEQIKSELRAMVCAHPQPAQEPVQGEPVCYADFDENGVIECTQNNPKGLLQAVPLYTQPQPAPLVRLTDEEIEKLVHPHYKSTESFVAGINFDLKITHAIMDAMIQKNGGGE